MPKHKGVIPVYINNFNRLESVRAMISYLSQVNRCEAIIVDNGSTYGPLLEWYRTAQARIIYLDGNYGHRAPWMRGAVMWPTSHVAYFGSEYYVVTDADLDLGRCPIDLLDVLVDGFERHPSVRKVGLGLELRDLPSESPFTCEVLRWESRFWTDMIDNNFYKAEIDTTFALYRADREHAVALSTSNALRTGYPYVARHLPWYLTPSTVTKEDMFYLETCSSTSSHWSKAIRDYICKPSLK